MTSSRSPLVLCAALSFALATPALAQRGNLVKNGDFSAPTIAPWTATGYAVNPGLDNIDVDGTGMSPCYGCHPGGQTNTGPFPPHQLQQQVVLPLTEIELTVDVIQYGNAPSLSIAQAQIDVFAGTQKLVTWRRPSLSRRTDVRERLCVRFMPVAAGPQTLSVEFLYPSLARTQNPKFLVDNVALRIARDPSYCIRGDRVLGTTVEFGVQGTANGAYVVFLSPGLLPQPVQVPGFSGDFALDLQLLLPFLQGALDAQGMFATKLAVPAIPSLAGVRLYWQGLQVSTAGAGFGWESQQAFYQ